VGPNQLYVRIARELGRLGFAVLRFDLSGIGDSQGGTTGNRTFVDDTLDAMALLRQRVGAERYLLMGICMGAKIALEVARCDERVESLVLMEGVYVKSARYHVSRLLDPKKWKRVITAESHMVRQIRSRLVRRLNGSNGSKGNGTPTASNRPKSLSFFDERSRADTGGLLRELLGRGVRVMLVFRDGNDIAYNYRLREDGDDIHAVGLPAGLSVAFVRFADHTFTPLVSQDLLLGVVRKWISRGPESAALPSPVAL
jgi:pimeloyl-ACP methyl ester carboxylesterase